jgi:hypothetical protein
MEKAKRHNTDKRKWGLISFFALEPMVQALEFGTKKYGIDNWKKGLDKKEVLESLMRHLVSLMDGELRDKESNILHIGHIFANAMFWSYFYFKENTDSNV